MTSLLRAMVCGWMLAAYFVSQVGAEPTAIENGHAERNDAQLLAKEHIVIAWSQRIVRVGPSNPYDRWRCAVTVNGVRYISTAVSEAGARARMATRIKQRPYCRRERKEFFNFGIGVGF